MNATSGLRLSVLDLCKRSGARSSREALEQTLALATLADDLGYNRFWVAEHHVEDSVSACPEVLAGVIAARTRRIRIGSGGVLLRYYSPFKVAEAFLLLESLFPGRIDLGVAKGPGVTTAETARALVTGNEWELGDESFERKVFDLIRYLRSARYPAHEGNKSLAPRPWGVTAPPVWTLGSGSKSARLAALLGVPYAFSLFFENGKDYQPDPIFEYRTAFRPSTEHSSPTVCVAVSALCLEDETDAQERHRSLIARGYLSSNVVGSPQRCAAQLRELAERFETDEFMITTWLQGEDRVRTYQYLAEEMPQTCDSQPLFSSCPAE